MVIILFDIGVLIGCVNGYVGRCWLFCCYRLSCGLFFKVVVDVVFENEVDWGC